MNLQELIHLITVVYIGYLPLKPKNIKDGLGLKPLPRFAGFLVKEYPALTILVIKCNTLHLQNFI
jgi:hypothetical protein